MKCPLFTAAEIAHEPDDKPHSNDCDEEECAWWDEYRHHCAIHEVSLLLYALGNCIAEGLENRGEVRAR